MSYYESHGHRCLVLWEYDIFDVVEVVERVADFMLEVKRYASCEKV